MVRLYSRLLGDGRCRGDGGQLAADAGPGHRPDRLSGSFIVTNESHPGPPIVITGMRLALSCGSVPTVSELCGAPDLGVFAMHPDVEARGGPECTGPVAVSPPDAAGVVTFTPQSPLSVPHASYSCSVWTSGSRCRSGPRSTPTWRRSVCGCGRTDVPQWSALTERGLPAPKRPSPSRSFATHPPSRAGFRRATGAGSSTAARLSTWAARATSRCRCRADETTRGRSPLPLGWWRPPKAGAAYTLKERCASRSRALAHKSAGRSFIGSEHVVTPP